jgi:hypothetical protein
MLLRILPGLLVVGLLASCSGAQPNASTALPDDAVITYAFHDASVPPASHRSVTLTVTRDLAHIVVDSYGEVLADATAPMPAATWSALSSTLGEVSAIAVVEPSAGCTGGTSADLTVSSGRDDIVTVTAGFCGGSNAKAGKAIDAWLAPARDLFPATNALAPS